MNCKQGDLALIVRSAAGNEGKIVRCVELAGSWGGYDGDGMRWVTEPPVRGMRGELAYPVLDCNMRPLRDSDGADEAMRIVGRLVGAPMAA